MLKMKNCIPMATQLVAKQQTRNISSTSTSSMQTIVTTSEDTVKSASGKEFEIEFVQGVSEEDKSLSRRDKNAVDFVFNYSKLWCKACKDIVLALEKCALSENEACRIIAKQFQALEASVTAVTGAPMKQETISLARMMIEKCKDTETHNSKRCRELLEVLTRQRTSFEKTRKFLKDKWKADVKRLLDAENTLIKTKASYYQRCQTGVKLREELAIAQNLLNEMGATQSSGNLNSPGGLTFSSGMAATSVYTGGTASGGAMTVEGVDDSGYSTVSGSSSSQISKQKAKVERLEKQLTENDKKEFEQMYAYREAVETANNRLYDLEKSKMEILADTRLTILKSDEVVKDSLAELFQHLFSTRMPMISQYETLATAFQSYVPCSGYRSLIEEHIQKSTEYCPEKYQFAGFHESSTGSSKLDALPGRFLVRVRVASKEEGGGGGDVLSGLHSDSDSDEEQATDSAGPASAKVSSSSNMLSSLVEFGSSFFRADAKKSIRGRRAQAAKQAAAAAGSNVVEAVDSALILEKECTAACFLLARCIAAIEKQPGGLDTRGIYRVPPSKVKIAALMESFNCSKPTSLGQFQDEVAILCQEHPVTLAGLVKSRLIALPEPLLTYNLYPNFVELGKVFESTEENTKKELVKRLQLLINHLGPVNRKLAGLLFHHLNRIAACQSENQMNSINLGTMFAPTVLRQRPKFQVANMMEFVDNKGQTRVVEVLVDCAEEIFGPRESFEPTAVLQSLLASDETESDSRRNSDMHSLQQTSEVTQQLRSYAQAADSSTTITQTTTTNNNSSMTHGLARSATISAGPSGRSIALLGNPLPLYSPYREEPSRAVGQSQVDAKAGPTDIGRARLFQLAERPALNVVPSRLDTVNSSNIEVTSNCDSTTTHVFQSTSPVKYTQYHASQTSHSQQQNSSTTFGSMLSSERQGTGTSTISNLIIGRRLQTSMLRDTHSNPIRRNKPVPDIDDYGFIDMDSTDQPDS